MKFRFFLFFAILFLLGNSTIIFAQVDSLVGQVTASTSESFVGGLSGDGRFAVIESSGNIATENPRNTDGNREIFLFDYAQRRIFQITDTKSLLKDATMGTGFSNIRVDIVNARPVISNDGRWIAFGSNATTSTPTTPNETNPGNFDGNAFNTTTGTTTTNPLTADGNTEIWLYRIPDAPPVNLSSGDELPLIDLSAGSFIRVTNTLPSRTPVEGTTTSLAVIADDNRNPSINDDGSVVAFISTRDLEPCQTTASAACGNAYPNFDNPEVYAFARALSVVRQVTATARGTILRPIYNVNPVISGNGGRVAFLSNADNPIKGMTGGTNSDLSDEIFFSDLDASGAPAGTRRQVTTTAAANPGDIVNIFSYGPRMSRDGRYIAFESFADFKNEVEGTGNANATAVFVFDATIAPTTAGAEFQRIGPRADADAGASQGDVLRFPTFTDYEAAGLSPGAVIFASRLNINAAGTIPATASDGLNPDAARPTQVYEFRLTGDAEAPAGRYTRLTKFAPGVANANLQAFPSNSKRRISFSLAAIETGTGNFDRQTEAYYLLRPVAQNTTPASLNFATGASAIPVTASPVPTPSPTATPTPNPSPSPSATPTPQTPPAVQGLSAGMLAIVNIDTGITEPVTPKTAVGSIQRRFQLPIELSGVTVSINGAAAGLKMVSRRQITFVVPEGLSAGTSGATSYPIVINNNGTVFRGSVTIVPARPDIFTTLIDPGPGGRARVQNVVNRVPTGEPFNVTTVRLRGGRRVATVLRVYATGIFNASATPASYTVRIGSTTLISTTTAVQREPGVYSLDITLPAALAGSGDQPIVLTVTIGGQTFTSRLDDTAPRIRIL